MQIPVGILMHSDPPLKYVSRSCKTNKAQKLAPTTVMGVLVGEVGMGNMELKEKVMGC